MAVQSTLSFEQTPPIRPGEADIIDGEKTNKTVAVPPNMPSAQEFMQMARQIVALAGMAPVAILSIEFTAGAPVIANFKSMRQDLLVGDFTLADNGAGDTSITWAAGKFPARIAKPVASLNIEGSAADHHISAYNITNGVRIRTNLGAGTGADDPFTVAVF